MLMQIIFLLVLMVAVYVGTPWLTVEKLGKGNEEVTKFAAGLAQIVLGFFVFTIAGEDEKLLSLAQDDLEFPYYLVRYGFLLDALFGVVQTFIAVFGKIDKMPTEVADVLQMAEAKAAQAASAPAVPQRKTSAAPVDHIPAWKRVQMEQESGAN